MFKYLRWLVKGVKIYILVMFKGLETVYKVDL